MEVISTEFEVYESNSLDEAVKRQIDGLKREFEGGAISYSTYWNEVQNIMSNYNAQQR